MDNRNFPTFFHTLNQVWKPKPPVSVQLSSQIPKCQLQILISYHTNPFNFKHSFISLAFESPQIIFRYYDHIGLYLIELFPALGNNPSPELWIVVLIIPINGHCIGIQQYASYSLRNESSHDTNFVVTGGNELMLTHWGRVTHICFSKLTIIGSDNGLSPGCRQAIFWTNAGILLIGPLGTNLSDILVGIQTFSFR